MQNHCKRLQVLRHVSCNLFCKLVHLLAKFPAKLMPNNANSCKKFLVRLWTLVSKSGGAFVWWIFFFFGVQEFVASLEASTLQSLYLQHNYLSSFGSLATASIPPTVAVCVQYNCQLPPPQSLCPENAGLIARPINECTKFTGTQNSQPPFFPWVT